MIRGRASGAALRLLTALRRPEAPLLAGARAHLSVVRAHLRTLASSGPAVHRAVGGRNPPHATGVLFKGPAARGMSTDGSAKEEGGDGGLVDSVFGEADAVAASEFDEDAVADRCALIHPVECASVCLRASACVPPPPRPPETTSPPILARWHALVLPPLPSRTPSFSPPLCPLVSKKEVSGFLLPESSVMQAPEQAPEGWNTCAEEKDA